MTRNSRAKPATGNQRIVGVPVERIIPDPEQPRKSFPPAEVSSLAQSLVETGQISPMVVRPAAEGEYVIVVGERRWRAAKEAGLSHIDCIVREDLDEQKAREMQFAENYQREDIPPLEQARSWKQYLDTYHLSQSELSRRTAIPQRTISARLALLKLPPSMHARVQSGEIGPHEALQITALPADQQEAVAQAVASGQIGGRALERLTCPHESPVSGGQTPQDAAQLARVVETTISLSQKVENLERMLYEFAATYQFNEAAAEMGEQIRKAPPCPECLKQGSRGAIQGIKRGITSEESLEWIENVNSHGELSEEEKKEILKDEPTHVIEAKCSQCGFAEVICHVRE